MEFVMVRASVILLFVAATVSGQYVARGHTYQSRGLSISEDNIPPPSGQINTPTPEPGAYVWDTILYLNFEAATLGSGISLAAAQTIWGSPNSRIGAGLGSGGYNVSIVDVPALDDGTGPATRVWKGEADAGIRWGFEFWPKMSDVTDSVLNEEIWLFYNIAFMPGTIWPGSGKIPGMVSDYINVNTVTPPADSDPNTLEGHTWEGGLNFRGGSSVWRFSPYLWYPRRFQSVNLNYPFWADPDDVESTWNEAITDTTWFSIAYRIVPNQTHPNILINGHMNIFVNEVCVLSYDTLVLVTDTSLYGMEYLKWYWFWGGGVDSYPVQDEWIWLDDAFVGKPNKTNFTAGWGRGKSYELGDTIDSPIWPKLEGVFWWWLLILIPLTRKRWKRPRQRRRI